MFILPYTLNVINQTNMQVVIIRVLTIGGKYVWEEDSKLDIYKDILNPNDIYCKSIADFDKKLKLCSVDTNRTNLNDFYKWDEIDMTDEQTFCWRQFAYLLSNPSHLPWLEIPETEKLGKYSVRQIIQKLVGSHLNDNHDV